MISAERLQQILEYAQALEMAAKYGRGNKSDTADIVLALQELQAYRQFDPKLRDGDWEPPKPRPRGSQRSPQQRKVA